MSVFEWLVPIVIISIWMPFYFIVCRMMFRDWRQATNIPRTKINEANVFKRSTCNLEYIPRTKNNEPNMFKCITCDLEYIHPDPKNVLEYAIHHRNFHKIENNEQAALQDFLFPLEEEKK